MTKREMLERKRRRKRIRRIRMAIKIAVYTLMAVLLGLLLWGMVTLVRGWGNRSEEETVQETIVPDTTVPETAVPEEVISAMAPEETYTGTGGKKGWNVDDAGWWFLNDDETIFTNGWQTIDGNTYYFDETGYMATGWRMIDGQFYYFRQDGLIEEGATEKLVALTFDDGPSEHTERLLNCLEANGVKATFFIVGENAEDFPDILKRAADMGMEIGSHTYEHTYLYSVSAEKIQETMNKNEEVIASIIGHGTVLMRPTGGGVNDTVRATVTQPMINWDVDTKDWDSKDVDAILEKVYSLVQDGSIILLHDLYPTTVDAVEIFVPQLISQGYRFVTVSEMAQLRGVTLERGQVYTSFYPPQEEDLQEE